MKNQAVFSSKDKSKKLKCHLLQFFGFVLKGLMEQYTKKSHLHVLIRYSFSPKP